MLHPFCVMVHDVSGHVPDSAHLPSTLAHVPVPPPVLLPELQASASTDPSATPQIHLAMRMAWD